MNDQMTNDTEKQPFDGNKAFAGLLAFQILIAILVFGIVGMYT